MDILLIFPDPFFSSCVFSPKISVGLKNINLIVNVWAFDYFARYFSPFLFNHFFVFVCGTWFFLGRVAVDLSCCQVHNYRHGCDMLWCPPKLSCETNFDLEAIHPHAGWVYMQYQIIHAILLLCSYIFSFWRDGYHWIHHNTRVSHFKLILKWFFPPFIKKPNFKPQVLT